MRANDILSGAVLIIAAAAMTLLSAEFRDFPGQKYGPALFPRILAAGLVICAVLLVVRGARARRQGGPWLALDNWARRPLNSLSIALVIALIVAYIVLSESIGFLPFAFAMLLVLMLWLRVRPLTAIAASLVATIVTHWFFASMMRVPLPRGLLTNLL